MPEPRDRRTTPLDSGLIAILDDEVGSVLFRSTPRGGGVVRQRGRGRASHSVLPSWYPRTPLRDITVVVRAIERRRIRLGENEGQQTGTPKLPTPAASKVPKILLDIANQSEGESEFLTPEKKLLNSIDAVEKVVREELQKLKRTPSAKKAEREKRVRTLMSMR